MTGLSHDEQVELLRHDGVEKWNQWRIEHSGVQPDLSGALLFSKDLREANLGRANLEKANLSDSQLSRADLGAARLSGAILNGTDLSRADLSGADLREANMSGAILFRADLREANLARVKLSHAYLSRANLQGVDLRQVDLRRIDFNGADLRDADLRDADLRDADLSGADLHGANLSGAKLAGANMHLANLSATILVGTELSGAVLREANLTQANLDGATLHRTDLTQAQLIGTSLCDANLADCRIYGISTWDLRLERAVQTNLRITPDQDPEITSDDLEVAQFLYLMLHNEKIRKVIDTLTSRVVLILGRFTEPRKQVLDAIREKLRAHPHHYVPVLFDFDGPASKSTTATITLLARMARFVVADLTDPSSVSWELGNIIPSANVPVQTLLLEGHATFSMADDLWRDHPRLMLPLCRYTTLAELLDTLDERVIGPAEARAQELQRQRMLPIAGLP